MSKMYLFLIWIWVESYIYGRTYKNILLLIYFSVALRKKMLWGLKRKLRIFECTTNWWVHVHSTLFCRSQTYNLRSNDQILRKWAGNGKNLIQRLFSGLLVVKEPTLHLHFPLQIAIFHCFTLNFDIGIIFIPFITLKFHSYLWCLMSNEFSRSKARVLRKGA